MEKLQNSVQCRQTFWKRGLRASVREGQEALQVVHCRSCSCLAKKLVAAAAAAAIAAKSLQSCPTLCDPIDGRQPTRLPRPWDSPGKTTGVGCHFLLQCMKVKRESEVAQSCLTLSDPMDCSLPGSSIHGIFQARVLEWGAVAFSADGCQMACILFLPEFPQSSLLAGSCNC